jgi:hypothetical protein
LTDIQISVYNENVLASTISQVCVTAGSVLHPIAEYFLVYELVVGHRIRCLLRKLEPYCEARRIPGVVIELPFVKRRLQVGRNQGEEEVSIEAALGSLFIKRVKTGLGLLVFSELLRLIGDLI